MIVQVANFAANLSGNKKKIELMSHRRQHVIGRGKGQHAPELQRGNQRQNVHVKPVISRRQHGRPVNDNEVGDGCAGVVVGIIIAAIYFLTL